MRKEYREVYSKVKENQEFTDSDWFTLLDTYRRPTLFNKKKEIIQDIMTPKLISQNPKQLSDSTQFCYSMIINHYVSKEKIMNYQAKCIAFFRTFLSNSILYFCIALLATLLYGLSRDFAPANQSLFQPRRAMLLVFLIQSGFTLFRTLKYKYKNFIEKDPLVTWSKFAAYIITLCFLIGADSLLRTFTWASYQTVIITWVCMFLFFLICMTPVLMLQLRKCKRYLSYTTNFHRIKKITKTQWDELYRQMEEQKLRKTYSISEMPLLKDVMYEILDYDYDWAIGLCEDVPEHIRDHCVFRYFNNLALEAFNTTHVPAQNIFDKYCATVNPEEKIIEKKESVETKTMSLS